MLSRLYNNDDTNVWQRWKKAKIKTKFANERETWNDSVNTVHLNILVCNLFHPFHLLLLLLFESTLHFGLSFELRFMYNTKHTLSWPCLCVWVYGCEWVCVGVNEAQTSTISLTAAVSQQIWAMEQNSQNESSTHRVVLWIAFYIFALRIGYHFFI